VTPDGSFLLKAVGAKRVNGAISNQLMAIQGPEVMASQWTTNWLWGGEKELGPRSGNHLRITRKFTCQC